MLGLLSFLFAPIIVSVRGAARVPTVAGVAVPGVIFCVDCTAKAYVRTWNFTSLLRGSELVSFWPHPRPFLPPIYCSLMCSLRGHLGLSW